MSGEPRKGSDGNVWVLAGTVDALAVARRRVFRYGGQQVALFYGADGGAERVWACANPCPHEGYPLLEGTLDGCILTCNWHNWKFDLTTGAVLGGGDSVRIFAAQIRGGEIWVNMAAEPAALRQQKARDGLAEAFFRLERDRIAREAARLEAAGADSLDSLRWAIQHTHDRLQYGATHALGAAEDWLELRAGAAQDPAERLAALTEVLVHLAHDTLRADRYLFAVGARPWDEAGFLVAIEAEDEASAVEFVRGALASGLRPTALRPALARAALAHYADFGHSLIYTQKLTALAERLGPSCYEPVLLALVRSFVHAQREDLIPEFRSYAPALAAWSNAPEDSKTHERPQAKDFAGVALREVLERTLQFAGQPQELFQALLGAAALHLLRFDLSQGERNDRPVSKNVSWLDFTHALTFADALADLQQDALNAAAPSLWPAGLLQLACFVGRTTGLLDPNTTSDDATSRWLVDDPLGYLAQLRSQLLDHGHPEPIVSAHLIKTATAALNLIRAAPHDPSAPLVAAAVHRFVSSPFKRRHLMRDARQALARVASEA